ncbi:uncharacterized protein LOC125468667 [Pyrus x bretschneideri]|uniref:uncharacterized protein LOC125468667 n=1 Tax=Pyrus x bretschneideri TaxID=225117 RepID=UPI00203057A7|nr:uncharacterized protein LOC125468667 [Pyrus x bretschneideri]
MQMAQYQASLDIEVVEMINAEVELANSLMQHEHHAESSYHGSVMGHSFVQRDREQCHDRMMKDYFIECLRFPAHDFFRQFRMRRELFESILNAVVNHDHYFARKIDAIGQQSLPAHQKLTSAFWMLANGCSTDSTDEYCQLTETTAIKNLKHLCGAIQAIYGATYLRKTNHEDLKRLLLTADKKGFPGMIGNLDCMHWEWKNCPTAWAGQFKGLHNKPTIVLKALASYDTWIWYAFFGTSGSNNNINVLWSSPLFDDVVNG